MIKHATTEQPIHDLIAERWSPYGFQDRAVSKEDLRSLFEAARWAASSFNEQPWRYIVATREQPAELERMLSCLLEANQEWARAVPVMALGLASLNFSRNEKPNYVALHDLGQASANLCLEATSRGLAVHQMRGILPDRARELYRVPQGVDVVTALAIGYASDPDDQEAPFRERDITARQRKPLKEFVFHGSWGRAVDFSQ